ncbi:DUF659 domain-containing protein [Aphis craccivora]|uniref:DUF659 domain-containing protein n=1 Tax=Aphis craccivora TaxID=307492 RepID=A0A6G0YQV9_APHCR|nr:DUF659 domain-containing protein [Aphis craccivora]
MPKQRSKKISLFKQWIEPFNADGEVFTSDGTVIYCQLCDRKIPCIKKSQLVQHVETNVHQNGIKRKSNSSKQVFFSEATTSKVNTFNQDLCLSLVAANIPWKKLQNTEFRQFLEKYTNKHIPDESTLRKTYLGPCYQNVISQIRDEVGDSYIWISVDETTDINGRFIANLIIGVLHREKATRSYLISCKELSKTNHSTVTRFVNDSLKILWPTGGNDDKVLLLLSDAAPYMVKSGDVLKVLYPNLIHVTCLAHGLNRVAEKVRDMFPNVNKLVNNIKKIFLKAPSRVEVYREIMQNIPLPPEPVLTRWGTWLEAVVFNASHFEGLKSVITRLDPDSSASIKKCSDIIKIKSVKNDLTFIKCNFEILVKCIKKLEQSKLTLKESLDIVQKCSTQLKNIPGDKGHQICLKMEDVLQKNQGYQMLSGIQKVLSGDEDGHLPINYSPDMASNMKFSPITSVDVERSFSLYKHILSDRRTHMTPEHMEQYIVINCFMRDT